MYKKFKAILISLLAVFLVGCVGENIVQKPVADGGSAEVPPQELITAIFMEREIVSVEKEGVWGNTWYIGNVLYYMILEHKEDSAVITKLLKKEGSNDSKILFEQEGVVPASLTVDTHGNVYYIQQIEDDYMLKKMNANGEVLFCQPWAADMSEGMDYEVGIEAAADEQGYYLLTVPGTVLAWNEQLQEQAMLQPIWKDELQEDVTADFGLLNGKAGTYAYYRAGSNITLQKINTYAKSLEDAFTIKLPVKPMTEQIVIDSIRLFDGYDKGIYVFFEDSLYAYADDTGNLQELLCWAQSGIGINAGSVNAVGQGVDHKVILATYNMSKEQGVLLHVEEKQVAGQQIIEIGYIGDAVIGTYREEVVTTFNSLRGDVQVVYKEYEDLNELHLALIQGKGPDIIDVHGLDVEEYVEKGILEDLNPYLEASEKIKKEDILPSIREIMTIENGIRVIFPSFICSGILMNKSIRQEEGMTTEEFLELTAPETDRFLCNKQDGVLILYLFPLVQDKYVNWENRTCNFADGEFAQFLKSLKGADLPSWKDTKVTTNLYNGTAILEGDCLAWFDVTVESMRKYRMLTETFGRVAEFAGYPAEQGSQSFLVTQNTGWLGINSASTHKEEAWDFLEFYMLEYADSYADSGKSFSVLEDAFEKQLHPQAKEGGIYSYINPYTGVKTEETFDYTEEERAAVREMVNSAVYYSFSSGMIGEIIQEETWAYFKGDKTAEEVAEIIQSRVSIYMAE